MTVPPFDRLDPDLALAETLLAPGRALAAVAAALPDHTAAARRLNAVLAASGATPRLHRTANGWRIVTLSGDSTPDTPAAAASGLAGLIAADGWHRLKRCAAPSCGAAFIDRTNAAVRRYCRTHSRHGAPR